MHASTIRGVVLHQAAAQERTVGRITSPVELHRTAMLAMTRLPQQTLASRVL